MKTTNRLLNKTKTKSEKQWFRLHYTLNHSSARIRLNVWIFIWLYGTGWKVAVLFLLLLLFCFHSLRSLQRIQLCEWFLLTHYYLFSPKHLCREADTITLCCSVYACLKGRKLSQRSLPLSSYEFGFGVHDSPMLERNWHVVCLYAWRAVQIECKQIKMFFFLYVFDKM